MSEPNAPLDRLPKSRRDWIALIAALNVRPSKGMGQNFLLDHGVVERIVAAAGVAPGSRVVEVGPGLGILTAHLLAAGARVEAIELDWQLAHHMRTRFGDLPGFTLHQADALKVELASVVEREPYTLVANLPYSIASAVVMHALESTQPPSSMTVMLQREVAERLIARPPGMTVLSVAAQILATAGIAFLVPAESFVPAPKVESAVVTLTPLGEGRLATERRPLFFRLVNAGFRHKRKQILNSLAFEIELPKEELTARLSAAGIDPLRRAQTLSVAEWLALLDAWEHAEPRA